MKREIYKITRGKDFSLPVLCPVALAGNSDGITRVTRLKVFFLLITLAIVIWTIITVELTLVYNSISGVYTIESTGQLIPFIIGIVGVGKTVDSIMINVIKKVSHEQFKHTMTSAHAISRH